MSKKKDDNKCPECGWRIVLASTNIFDIRVEPHQEPYEANVIEPVIVSGQKKDEILISISANCHVCPNCGWVCDFTFSSNM